MTARVHYVAAGVGLVFDCFRREMREHLASATKVPRDEAYAKGWVRTAYAIKAPRRHTSLDRVTCAECWAAIFAMAGVRLRTLRAKAGA